MQKGILMDYIDVLSDALSTFYNATNISVALLSKKGDIIKTFGVEQTYCQLFPKHISRPACRLFRSGKAIFSPARQDSSSFPSPL